MIEVAQYIEHLLRQHDCVIVPGLGGFIAQDCAATYIEEECCFLPPYRSVTFNPCLTMNDGLFVHEIAEQHHLSYDDALTAVNQAVNEIHKRILTKGKYKIAGVGTLENVNAKSYEFTPLPYGIEAPDLYGLDSYYFAPIQQETDAEEKGATESAVNVETTTKATEDNDHFTLSIPMNVIRYAAVAAVSVVFFFICIAPFNTAIHQGRNEAGMFQSFWNLIEPQLATVQPSESTSEARTAKAEANATASEGSDIQTTESEEKSDEATTTGMPTSRTAQTSENTESVTTEAAEATATAETAAASVPHFAISVATAIPEEGAKGLVATMKSYGLPDAHIVKDDYIRVVYGYYTTEAEAKTALATLRQNNSAFAQSWVLQVK